MSEENEERKTMKKLLAMILTALLILSMSAVAFAETTEEYTDATTVTVNKTYKLVGAGSSPAETFTLEQVGEGEVTDGEATSAPALGTITGAAFDAGAATAEGASGEITIALPTYTKVGVYEYTLRESAGTNGGVTYFAGNIKLVVTVINGEDGKLRIAGVHTEAEDEGKSDTFENTYSAGTLSITNTVTGILGDTEKYFEFTVTLTGAEGKDYAASYAVTGGSYATNPTAISVGTPATIYLKDGETLSIENLPYGVSYTVDEKDYSGEGYNVTESDTTGTINAAAQTAAFTNEKGGSPDTGILLDSLPYVIILAVVAAAGVAMLLKRRKTER